MSSVRIRSPQDLGAAVVFIAIGIAGLVFGQDLAFGTSAKMGPGYFPTILSGMIIAIGALLLVNSLVVDGPSIERVQFRPLFFIVVAIVSFGYLIQLLGLAITAIIMTVVAAYARREVKLRENLWLGAGLALFAVLVFIYGLSQPLQIGWWAT